MWRTSVSLNIHKYIKSLVWSKCSQKHILDSKCIYSFHLGSVYLLFNFHLVSSLPMPFCVALCLYMGVYKCCRFFLFHVTMIEIWMRLKIMCMPISAIECMKFHCYFFILKIRLTTKRENGVKWSRENRERQHTVLMQFSFLPKNSTL